jgi:hypothetical protein
MQLTSLGRLVLLAAAAILFAQTSPAAGKPVLIVGSNSNPYSFYNRELLQAEGLNVFDSADIASVSAASLAAYDIVLLGHVPLTSDQAAVLTNWVNGGGYLIAMRPDKQLAALLGIADTGSTLSNTYLAVNTAVSPGQGITSQPLQFHGSADLYLTTAAAAVATLYTTRTSATSFPAVTLRTGIGNGGKAAAFTYDLARSVVYTRQGNPAWSGQARIGIGGPIRSSDMFYGNAVFDPQPDWVDLANIAIPQADEQQRLLVNLIHHMNLSRKPLPRFWYFPSGKRAVVVMTGDDHGQGATAGRFDDYLAKSPAGCSVPNWECIRGTSYIYPSTPLSDAQAATYTSQGFEVALHVNTNCANFTLPTLQSFFATQLSSFASSYPSLPAPVTNRTHCIAFSDWSSTPVAEASHGIRLDTNYYYWPASWVVSTPGFFTGSGIPMRFAQTDGTPIDVYQATTQLTDESGQAYPATIDVLLDNALGSAGFYGAFTANIHTDSNSGNSKLWSDQIVASAQARGVSIITAKQLLDWLNTRNGSTFSWASWTGNTLTFTVTATGSVNGLMAMLPISGRRSQLDYSQRGPRVLLRADGQRRGIRLLPGRLRNLSGLLRRHRSAGDHLRIGGARRHLGRRLLVHRQALEFPRRFRHLAQPPRPDRQQCRDGHKPQRQPHRTRLRNRLLLPRHLGGRFQRQRNLAGRHRRSGHLYYRGS